MPEEIKMKNSIIGKEIFSVGEWNGDNYTIEDLEEMVRAYNDTCSKYKPYIKLGHVESQDLLKQEGLPSAGWIQNLRVEGDKLVCDISDIPEKVYKLIKENAYRYVSAEIFWNIDFEGKKYERMLSGCAILGAEMPAVTNLNEFINLYKLDAKFIKSYTFKKEDNMPEIKPVVDPKKELLVDPKEIKPEEKKPVIEPKVMAELPVIPPEVKPEEVKAPSVEELTTKVADLEKKLAEIMLKLDEANAENFKCKEALGKTQVEKFISEKNVAPAAQEYVRQLLGDEKKSYSVNNKEMTKQDMVGEILKIYAAGNVNVVETSEKAVVIENDEDKTVNDIKAYAAANKITFAAAYKKLSANKGTELNDEEEGE